jgi:prepilin-type N-terminal cleavage/methylation domain-containing protein
MMNTRRRQCWSRSAQRGLSLVEMMVGITVGLFIVAAASMMVAMQLGENRRLLLETQVQQDLRATADIMTRELRRSGYWAAAQQSVWFPGAAAAVQKNPRTAVSTPSASEVAYSYERDINNAGPYGFKLENGRIKTYLGNIWQELTDANVLEITDLTFVEQDSAGALLPCPRECTGGGTACWPTLVVRDLLITITGRATSDAAVQRTVSSRVRLRNDLVQYNDAANPAAICPS